MRTKRITCAILCLIMVLALLPAAAFADASTSVWVGGADVSAGGYWLTNAGKIQSGGSAGNYNVHYDAVNHALTLNDAIITANYINGETGAAILANGALTIVLENDSSVRGMDFTTGSSANSFGIYCTDSLTIQGGGSLAAIGGKVETRGSKLSVSCGVFAGSVSVLSGTLTATGGKVMHGMSYGVIGDSSVTVQDGTLISTGGEVTYGISYGVYGTSVSMADGMFTATGSKATTGNTYGVFGEDSISITGGRFTAIGGEASGDYCLSYGMHSTSSVRITGGTVNATGGKIDSGYSYGVSGGSVVIEDSTLTAAGGVAKKGYSFGVSSSDSLLIKNSTVDATGNTITSSTASLSCGTAGTSSLTIEDSTLTSRSGAVTTGLSYAIYSNNVTISGSIVEGIGDTAGSASCGMFAYLTFSITDSTMLIQGNLCAIQMEGGATLATFDGDTAPHTVTVSENKNGLPAIKPDNDLRAYKYLRVAPGAVTVSDVAVDGVPGTILTETNATIALMDKRFSAMNEGADVSGWFQNMPAGLIASLKTAVAANAVTATVTFSGTPTAESTAAMAITIPSDMLNDTGAADVAANGNARWSIVAPSSIDTSLVTIYNDPSQPDATIWLSGRGLNNNDLLITERNPVGSAYKAILGLSDPDDVVATYNIRPNSGKLRTSSPLHLSFDLSSRYAGDAFTLVHQKANGTYEYFYDHADNNGDLTFGPLYELSPFMLVRGTLAPRNDASIPATGDSAQPALWLAVALTMAAAALASFMIRKRQRD